MTTFLIGERCYRSSIPMTGIHLAAVDSSFHTSEVIHMKRPMIFPRMSRLALPTRPYHNGGRHQRRWVDPYLRREPFPGDVDLVLGVPQHKVVGDEPGLACCLVKVLHISHAHVALERVAVGRRRDRAAVLAVAVDRFASPRPGVLVDVVVLEEELREPLSDAGATLVQEGGTADEATHL